MQLLELKIPVPFCVQNLELEIPVPVKQLINFSQSGILVGGREEENKIQRSIRIFTMLSPKTVKWNLSQVAR